MDETPIYEGGCLCGALRYRATNDPIGVVHCHCRNCQRHTGAAFVTSVGFSGDAFSWTKGQPTLYNSSKNGQRGFCSHCGSTVSFHWSDIGTDWVHAGTLDHPERVTPELHFMTATQVPWIKLDDSLPRYPRYIPERKGSTGDDVGYTDIQSELKEND